MSSSTKRATVNLNNWYYAPEAFSAEEIDKIHKLAETIEFREGVLNAGSNKHNSYRKSEVKWLDQEMEGIEWLYEKFTELIIEANNSTWQFEINEELKKIQYSVYHGDGGHYDWHMDLGGGIAAERKISIVVQLSSPEEYDGGEFEIFVQKDVIEFPKKQGSVVLFPSYYMHRVSPVTGGERKSLVLWVTGIPFR
ncbi:hypothetical protein AB832_01080 [Flavobacteriaceae bacterium (ex Bugula neritina AB1)]|nr:hypothetical protein AB832_01080 [Flavobacteriaceae bacterium (ex Bugula neritina AB1)]